MDAIIIIQMIRVLIIQVAMMIIINLSDQSSYVDNRKKSTMEVW